MYIFRPARELDRHTLCALPSWFFNVLPSGMMAETPTPQKKHIQFYLSSSQHKEFLCNSKNSGQILCIQNTITPGGLKFSSSVAIEYQQVSGIWRHCLRESFHHIKAPWFSWPFVFQCPSESSGTRVEKESSAPTVLGGGDGRFV